MTADAVTAVVRLGGGAISVVRLHGGGAAVVTAQGQAFTAGHCVSGLRVGDVSQGFRLVRVWRRWDLALLETSRESTLRLAPVDGLRPSRQVEVFGWDDGIVVQSSTLTRLAGSRARAVGHADVCSGDSGSPVLQAGRAVGIVIATTGPRRGANRRCASTAIFTRLDAPAVRRAVDTAWRAWLQTG